MFLRLKNRVNVFCSRAMDALVLIAQTKAVLSGKPSMRRHLGNVLTHVKEIRAKIKVSEPQSNEHVSAVKRLQDFASTMSDAQIIARYVGAESGGWGAGEGGATTDAELGG